MNHEFEREQEVLAGLLELSKRHSIPLLGTNDSHYALSDGSILHDAMLCLSTRTKLADEKRMRFDGQGYYLKSRSEMERLLPKEALDTTLLVSERIEGYGTAFDYRLRMPRSPYVNPEEKLRDLLEMALASYSQYPEYRERANYEYNIITRLRFTDYFLVLADGLAVAKSRGVRIGPGRGSAGGCLLSYLLGITAIDPIELDLSFERFLNADRVSLPDVDIDVPDDRRDEVIGIFEELYHNRQLESELWELLERRLRLRMLLVSSDIHTVLGKSLRGVCPLPASDAPQPSQTSRTATE